MLTTSSEYVKLSTRELAWTIHYLTKVVPVGKEEQKLLFDLILKYERELHLRKQ